MQLFAGKQRRDVECTQFITINWWRHVDTGSAEREKQWRQQCSEVHVSLQRSVIK